MNKKHSAQEKNRPSAASIPILILSDVKPLSEAISYVSILVSVPVDFVLSSYHPTLLYIIDLNNFTLSVLLRFSPQNAKQSFWTNVDKPIPTHNRTNVIVQMFLK